MSGQNKPEHDTSLSLGYYYDENPEAVRFLEEDDKLAPPPDELLELPAQPQVQQEIIDESKIKQNIVEVEFKGARRLFFENAENLELAKGESVIVEADKGVDLGRIHLAGEEVIIKRRERGVLLNEEKKIVRKATPEDIEQFHSNHDREKEASRICKEKIIKHGLPMKFVDTELQFDRNRVTFYFTAEKRVDFRELVKDLAGVFRTRIELRQIGVRDEAKRLGGIGSCGRELCCARWLLEFHRIGTQHARVQNLPLNPLKLSGQCSRLKCCLVYEVSQYIEALKRFPPLDSRVTTKMGSGRIEKVDIFKDLVYVHYDQNDAWDCLALSEFSQQLLITEKPI